MAIVDKLGNPLSIRIGCATPHELTHVMPLVEALPKNLIPSYLGGDANFSSGPLTQKLKQRFGIHFVAPDRRHYTKPLADKRRLRRNKRRWVIERTFSWIRGKRKLRLRFERYLHTFSGFVWLACMTIYFQHF
jgi:hypothetical protein